jgi:hypothetical protein
MRIVGVGMVASGVILMGVSAVFMVRASGAADEVVSRCGGRCEWNADLQDVQDDGRSAATLAWITSGAGVAAVASGALLYYFGRRAKGAEMRVSLSLRDASLGWSWAF